MRESRIDTPHGTGRLVVETPQDASRAVLLLGHGAGGSIEAPDLRAARDAALAAGLAVARFEQPYRVAGRRSPAPARQLDAAWLAAVAELRAAAWRALPLLCGGRSSGARVACRTAAAARAAGVLCLAFPLQPPRRGNRPPAPDRSDELDDVGVPVLVVQGRRDPFGMPEPAAARQVVQVDGDHRLAGAPALAAIHAAVEEWLARGPTA